MSAVLSRSHLSFAASTKLATKQRPNTSGSVRRARAAALRPMASAGLTAFVKGDPTTGTLGDCPFCHRALLTLETKHVPYTKAYVDFKNKPAIVMEKAEGKVPLIHTEPDFWLADSDKIVEWLEEKYPIPSMASSVPAEVGAKLFGAFRGVLKSTNEDRSDKEKELTEELQKIEDYLAAHGPLFGGQTLNATDAALAPKLYHTIVALKHFKGLELSSQFTAISKYMSTIKELPQWKATDYGEPMIIQGWANH